MTHPENSDNITVKRIAFRDCGLSGLKTLPARDLLKAVKRILSCELAYSRRNPLNLGANQSPRATGCCLSS